MHAPFPMYINFRPSHKSMFSFRTNISKISIIVGFSVNIPYFLFSSFSSVLSHIIAFFKIFCPFSIYLIVSETFLYFRNNILLL